MAFTPYSDEDAAFQERMNYDAAVARIIAQPEIRRPGSWAFISDLPYSRHHLLKAIDDPRYPFFYLGHHKIPGEPGRPKQVIVRRGWLPTDPHVELDDSAMREIWETIVATRTADLAHAEAMLKKYSAPDPDTV